MSTTTPSTEGDSGPLAAARPKKTTQTLVHGNVQLARGPPQGIEGHVPAPSMHKVKAHDQSVKGPLHTNRCSASSTSPAGHPKGGRQREEGGRSGMTIAPLEVQSF